MDAKEPLDGVFHVETPHNDRGSIASKTIFSKFSKYDNDYSDSSSSTYEGSQTDEQPEVSSISDLKIPKIDGGMALSFSDVTDHNELYSMLQNKLTSDSEVTISEKDTSKEVEEDEPVEKKIERLGEIFDSLDFVSSHLTDGPRIDRKTLKPVLPIDRTANELESTLNTSKTVLSDSTDDDEIDSTSYSQDDESSEDAVDSSDRDEKNSLPVPKSSSKKTISNTGTSKTHSKHACAYCGIYNHHSIVKCVNSLCEKWFCNHRKQKEHGSHIVQHLILSRHRKVRLHMKSCLKGAILDCHKCDSDNVFDLGFVTAKNGDVVLLLCRSCVSEYSKTDSKWDSLHWLPLINDRTFIPWLVKAPARKDIVRSKKITFRQIKALEELWNSGNVNASIGDVLELKKNSNVLKKVPLSYKNVLEYQKVFLPLIRTEEIYDRKLKEAQTQYNVAIRWEISGTKSAKANFVLSNLEQGNTRLAVGDELRIVYIGELVPGGGWSAVGNVIKIPNNSSQEITLLLKADASKISKVVYKYTIEFVWRNIPYKRMKAALSDISSSTNILPPSLLDCILGINLDDDATSDAIIPKKLSAPNLPALNPSQMHAVSEALKKRFSIIQGPPGTGKTVTSATIVYDLSRIYGKGILVVSPSNVAINNLCKTISLTGLNTVRVCAKVKESVPSPLDHLSLHKLVKDKVVMDMMTAEKKLHSKGVKFARMDKKWILARKKYHEKAILLNADVICCTCITSGDSRLARIKFHTVLVDEATQATEPECLIPLAKSTRMAIVVGDHKQLGPVVFSKEAIKAGFQQSLFERLVSLMKRPIRLQVQYRMHPCLSEFPSNMFYEGSLQNGISSQQRVIKHLEFPWPNFDSPMLFHCSYGSEELSPSGTSYINRTEATYVEKIVTWLLKANIKPSQIGIITPYDGQRSFLAKWMQQRGILTKELYRDIETSSVDSFQGREMDYIILTCVRSNNHNGIGFLCDPRRLNVALTRAKYGLVILGNPKVLSNHPLWRNLILHFKEKNCLVAGPLNNLKPAVVEFRCNDKSNRIKHGVIQSVPTDESKAANSFLYNKSHGINPLSTDALDNDFKRLSISTFNNNTGDKINKPKNDDEPLVTLSRTETRIGKESVLSHLDNSGSAKLPTPLEKVLDRDPQLDKSFNLLSISQDNFLNFGYKSQVESTAYSLDCDYDNE